MRALCSDRARRAGLRGPRRGVEPFSMGEGRDGIGVRAAGSPGRRCGGRSHVGRRTVIRVGEARASPLCSPSWSPSWGCHLICLSSDHGSRAGGAWLDRDAVRGRRPERVLESRTSSAARVPAAAPIAAIPSSTIAAPGADEPEARALRRCFSDRPAWSDAPVSDLLGSRGQPVRRRRLCGRPGLRRRGRPGSAALRGGAPQSRRRAVAPRSTGGGA